MCGAGGRMGRLQRTLGVSCQRIPLPCGQWRRCTLTPPRPKHPLQPLVGAPCSPGPLLIVMTHFTPMNSCRDQPCFMMSWLAATCSKKVAGSVGHHLERVPERVASDAAGDRLVLDGAGGRDDQAGADQGRVDGTEEL